MYIQNPPTTMPDGSPLNAEWQNFFQQIATFGQKYKGRGTTAQRNAITKGLALLDYYYDDDLDYMVWVHALNPTEWRDASGAVV